MIEVLMIEVKNVTKTYKETKVVDHVNFNIYEGGIFGFLGDYSVCFNEYICAQRK